MNKKREQKLIGILADIVMGFTAASCITVAIIILVITAANVFKTIFQ